MCGCFAVICELVATSSDSDSIGVFLLWSVGSCVSRIGNCFSRRNFVFVYKVEDILSFGCIVTLEEAAIFFFITPIPKGSNLWVGVVDELFVSHPLF